MEKKRFKNAERSLKSALKLSGRNGDFKTLYYLALVNDELLDKVETLKFCERALRFENASPSRRKNLTRLKTGILSSYGLVTLERASDIAPEYGIFSMRAQTSFLNPKKRRYVEKLREKFETKPVKAIFSSFAPRSIHCCEPTFESHGREFRAKIAGFSGSRSRRAGTREQLPAGQ